ncbi:MAG: tail fiber domain-containing protein, partial [Bacteroidales bacterium]
MNKKKMAKAVDPRGTVVAFQIDKDTKKVETVNGFTLVEDGQRVYSPSNKPTPATLGVLPTAGGTMTGNLDMGAKDILNVNNITNTDALNMIRRGGDKGVVVGNSAGAIVLDTPKSSKITVRESGNATTGHVYTTFHKPQPSELGALAVGDYGVGAKQGTAPLADQFAEDKTRDFNKLITAGEYTTDGSWSNGINNVVTAQGHTGMVKVEVRRFGSGCSYIQTYTYNSGDALMRIARFGVGTYPSITWQKWRKFGPGDMDLSYRLTINRTGDNLLPYITMNKETLPAAPTGNYPVSVINAKAGALADNNTDGGNLVGAIQFELDKEHENGTILMRTRKISTNADTTWLRLNQSGMTVRSGGKDLSFSAGTLTVDGAVNFNGRISHLGLGTNKQVLNVNAASEAVYLGNPTLKRVQIEVDTNGLAYVGAGSASHRIYHQGFKPTAADVGALSTAGGTINGQLVINDNNIRHRFVTSGNSIAFMQGGHVSDDAIQNLSISGYSGKSLTALRFYMKDATSPFVRWGSTDHRMYHQGFKPTAADVGAVATSGNQTMSGRLTVAGITSSTGGNAFQTGTTTNGVYGNISAESDQVMMWRRNASSTKADEFISINNGSSLLFRRDAGSGDRKYNDFQLYHQGFKPTPADVGAVATSGGTMTGHLNLSQGSILKFITPTYAAGAQIYAQNADQYGANLVITSGGATVLGSGEAGAAAAKDIVDGKLPAGEKMYIASDDSITFFTGANTWGERKENTLSNTGLLTIQNNLVVNNAVADKKMTVGTGNSDTWLLNSKANKYFQMRDNGDLQYDSKHIHYKGNPNTLGSMISESKAIGANENLDDYKTAGVYHQSANANATNGTNYPEKLAGSLIVRSAAGVTQEYHVYNSSKIWTRGQYATGGWTAWAKQYNTLNKPSADEIGAFNQTSFSGDLDTLTISGNYKLAGSAVANRPSGAPGNGDHVLNQYWDGNAGNQIYTSYTTGRMWTRSKNNKVWSPWRQVYDTNNKPSATDVGALSLTAGGTVSGQTVHTNRVSIIDNMLKFYNGSGTHHNIAAAGNNLHFATGPGGETLRMAILASGEVQLTNSLIVDNGRILNQRAANPMVELHQPGKYASIMYINSGGALCFSQSNGSGTDVANYIKMTKDNIETPARILSTLRAARSWTEVGKGAFVSDSSAHHVQSGSLNCALSQYSLVPNKYHSELMIGTLFGSDFEQDASTITQFNATTQTRKSWFFYNQGDMVSPSGSRLNSNGNVYGSVYGGTYVTNWVTNNFAPKSDANLKNVLGESKASALDIVDKFEFKSYVWKEEAGEVYTNRSKKVTEIGLIAQEVEVIDPNFVKDIKTFKEDGT